MALKKLCKGGASHLADVEAFPTALRAVFGYYADSGVFDYASLQLKQTTDEAVDAMVADAFGVVESALADAYDAPGATFDYGTKLVLPANLTFGYLTRRLDGDRLERARDLTRLIVEALIEGDMRDAINDAEFEDFEVSIPGADPDPERVATIAQETLQGRVEGRFDTFPDAVRDPYEWAVDYSEAHQDRDERFRGIMTDARDGAPDAPARIRESYKYAGFEERPTVFSDSDLELPYLKTQYARVGVIYDGMIEMYRAAGFDVETQFKKSIVLAIIGAQVWLDDVDDFGADWAAGQLTPVTAEYLLADDDADGYDEVVAITRRYLDVARENATAANSPLTGIAAEYIYRSGNPAVLPGSR